MGRTKGFDKDLIEKRRAGIVALCKKGSKASSIRKQYPSLSEYRIKAICREEGISRPRGRPKKGTPEFKTR